jgi:hypothetical protein
MSRKIVLSPFFFIFMFLGLRVSSRGGVAALQSGETPAAVLIGQGQVATPAYVRKGAGNGG